MSKLPGSPTFRLELHTGPSKQLQRLYKQQIKSAKAGRVVSLGTERIHIDVKGNSCEDAQMRFAKALQKKDLKRLSTQAWATRCQRRK